MGIEHQIIKTLVWSMCSEYIEDKSCDLMSRLLSDDINSIVKYFFNYLAENFNKFYIIFKLWSDLDTL